MKWLPLAVLCMCGCGVTGDDESLLSGAPSAAPPDAGAVVDLGVGQFNLTGTFAFEAVVKVQLVIDLESRQYFLVEFEQNGTQLRQKTTNCRIELPGIEGVAVITLPDAVLSLLRERPFESEGEFLSGTEVGASYQPDVQFFALGVDFTDRDPFTAPLPTKDDLTFARDEDGDGHPGVTLEVDTATCPEIEQLYVAMRTTVAMQGVVQSKNGLGGPVTATLDQVVLGFSDPCLQIAAGLRPEVQDESSFRAVRVEDGISCDELLPQVEALFPDPGG